MSWQAIYGVASDFLPIAGLHRSPYIIMAGFAGIMAWTGPWGSNV